MPLFVDILLQIYELESSTSLACLKGEKVPLVMLDFLCAVTQRKNVPGKTVDCIVYVAVVIYLNPSEEWEHGGRPWSPKNRVTPQGLDQRS